LRCFYPGSGVAKALNINGYPRLFRLAPRAKPQQIHPAGLIGAYPVFNGLLENLYLQARSAELARVFSPARARFRGDALCIARKRSDGR
jgi:hypothetical protein